MNRRYVFMCLVALFAPPALRAQEPLPILPAVDSISSDWLVQFPDAASRRDFRRLREYRAEKQNAVNHQRSQLEVLQSTRGQVETERKTWSLWASELSGILASAGDSTEVYIPYSYADEFDTFVSSVTPGTAQVSNLRSAEQRLAQQDSQAQQTLAGIDSVSQAVSAGIHTLEQDIRSAESTIDNALAPEYQSQKFRTLVSAFFALLIGIMIVAFFATIYKKAGDSVGTLLLSDGGLQFVTIFVLIIAIILFGILNILEGRELAAILSGIAGYILGRGAQVKSQASAGGASEPQPAPADATPPAGPPQTIRVPSVFIPPAEAPRPAAVEVPPAGENVPVSEAPAEELEPSAAG
jgi:hypothetical protein